MPSVGTESWADRPWKRTQSHSAETIRRAWSVVWVEWWGPPSAQSGVCSSSPSESALALPTPHCTLALDLGQTGPGRRCHKKQPKSQQLNHLNFSGHNTSSPNPRQLHITALHWIWDKQNRKEHDLGAASEQNCRHLYRWFKGPLWLHRPYLLQQLPPLWQGMHSRATEADIRASAPATEESALLPIGCTATATEQSSKPCSTTCTDSGHCNTNHTPITGIMASIPLENIRRCP